MVSPRHAYTFIPFSARAAATSSWVESGLDPHSATSAPPATSVSTSTPVSFVTCRHAPIIMFTSGFSRWNRCLIWLRTGMCMEAHSMSRLPCGARLAFLILKLAIGVHASYSF